MPVKITVPRLGWSMDEGTFSAWLKKDGERVEAGDFIYALESEKATQEIESFDSGILRIPPNAPRAGDTVKVGQVLGYLVNEGEEVPSADANTVAPQSLPLFRRTTVPQTIPVGPTHAPTIVSPMSDSDTARVPKISPRALRVALELDVDWTKVTGTGRAGRIREQDIRATVAADIGIKKGAAATPQTLSATRRTIAERMLTSMRKTAPVTLHSAADATNLVAFRHELKMAGKGAPIPGYTDLFVKLAAAVLQQHPALNARWEGEQLSVSTPIHIGIAVEIEGGLLVPVIRDAARLSLQEIAARSRDLVERARAKKLSASELSGGTFTVTNLGGLGIDAFTPIINYPECAILGLDRIRRQPAIMGDQIVPRDILMLSLTFDHQAIDGAPAARFLQTFCRLIESPAHHLIPVC